MVTVLGESQEPLTKPTSVALHAHVGQPAEPVPLPPVMPGAPSSEMRSAFADGADDLGTSPEPDANPHTRLGYPPRVGTAPPLGRRGSEGIADEAGDFAAAPGDNLLTGNELGAYLYRTAGAGTPSAIAMVGRLDYSFDRESLARIAARESAIHGHAVLSLQRVTRATPAGAQAWQEYLRMTAQSEVNLYLSHYPAFLLSRRDGNISLPRQVALISFWAPYVCGGCSHGFEHLFDCEFDVAVISGAVPPELPCPRCVGHGNLDRDIADYFAPVAPYLGQAVPESARAALAAMDQKHSRGQGAAAEAGSHNVEVFAIGRRSQIHVSGTLDHLIPWAEILRQCHQVVRIDLSAVLEATAEGLRSFVVALESGVRHDLELELDNCPPVVAAQLVDAGDTLDVAVISARVSAYCAGCRLPRLAHVDVEEHANRLAKGALPPLPCPRCHETLSRDSGGDGAADDVAAYEADTAILRYLGRNALGQSTWETTQTRGLDGMNWRTVVKVAVGAMLMLVAVAVGYRLSVGGSILEAKHTAMGVAEPDTPAAGEGPAAGSAQPFEAAALGAQEVELPPPWVDRGFAILEDRVLVVGRSGPAADVGEAMLAAHSSAVRRLLIGMVSELKGRALYAFVRANADMELTMGGQRGPSASGVAGGAAAGAAAGAGVNARIALRFQHQLSQRATLERLGASPRRQGERLSVLAWYALPRHVYDEAVAYYRHSDRFLGMEVAPAFPLLAGSVPSDSDLLVVDVERGSRAARAGIAVGDIIVAVDGQIVASIEDYAETVRRAWQRVRRRQSLRLRVLASSKGEEERPPVRTIEIKKRR